MNSHYISDRLQHLQESERIMETHRWLFNVITKRIQGADMAFKEGWGSVLSCLVVLIQNIKHQSKRRPEFKIILSMFPLRDLFRVDSKSVSLFVFFHFLLDVPSTLTACLFFLSQATLPPDTALIIWHLGPSRHLRIGLRMSHSVCWPTAEVLLVLFKKQLLKLCVCKANILPLTSYSVHSPDYKYWAEQCTSEIDR